MPTEANVTDTRHTIKELIACEMHVAPDSLSEELRLEAIGLNSLLLTTAISRIEDRFDTALDVSALVHVVTPTQRFGTLLDELTRHIGANR